MEVIQILNFDEGTIVIMADEEYIKKKIIEEHNQYIREVSKNE